MMFSCLFGVGYVIVRYRKNSVLKRLKATPLSALEFVSAQLISRMVIVMFTAVVVYVGANMMFDFYMLGSYFDLFVIGVLGAFSLISSGVWFSLEGAPDFIKVVADFLPLTHLVSGARKIITEGATLADIGYHISMLSIMSVIFIGLGAYLFSWDAER